MTLRSDEITEILKSAAELILARGHSKYADSLAASKGTGPLSIHTAVQQAVINFYGYGPAQLGRSEDVTEELETRIAGFLYMTGRNIRRTSIADMAGVPERWEDAVRRSDAAVVMVLTDMADAIAAAGEAEWAAQ